MLGTDQETFLKIESIIENFYLTLRQQAGLLLEMGSLKALARHLYRQTDISPLG